MESKFNISIPDEDLIFEKFSTAGLILNYLTENAMMTIIQRLFLEASDRQDHIILEDLKQQWTYAEVMTEAYLISLYIRKTLSRPEVILRYTQIMSPCSFCGAWHSILRLCVSTDSLFGIQY